jgi:hypothetical protein
MSLSDFYSSYGTLINRDEKYVKLSRGVGLAEVP